MIDGKDIYANCNFTYSLLGIETLITKLAFLMALYCNFTYSLLGIETIYSLTCCTLGTAYCNFTYSLLGIETIFCPIAQPKCPLQFHLLPIRD